MIDIVLIVPEFVNDLGKTCRTHVKALFEYMPAFPLSHACIVIDKLQQIPLWVREI
jgi:hypothetical protein